MRSLVPPPAGSGGDDTRDPGRFTLKTGKAGAEGAGRPWHRIARAAGQALTLAALLAGAGMSAAQQPNMVVIMVDDMGYECIGANGCLEYSTPIVDGMAASGLRFSNSHSTPVCTPTRTQIMTGRYGHRNYTRFTRLVESEVCFAELLRDAGYATMIAGKWQLAGRDLDTTINGFGFDEYAVYNLPGFEGASYGASGSGRFWNADIYTTGAVHNALAEDEYGPDFYTDQIIDFINRKAGSQPFLVYFPMALTHSPFVPTPHSTFTWPAGGAQEIYDTMDDPVWFKDMVEYADFLVGRILQALTDAGVRDDTLVIFTGDNGTHVSITTTTTSGEVQGGKNKTKKTGTHVPFIVDWPAQGYAVHDVPDLIDHSDILPTLIELAGAELPGDRVLDGVSFAPVLRGQANPNRREAVFCEWFGGGRTKRNLRDFALDERWKYFISGAFYDMDNDPEENSPIPEASMTAEMLAARDKLRTMIEQVYSRRDDAIQLATNPGFEDGLEHWRHFGNGWASTTDSRFTSSGQRAATVSGIAGDPLDPRWIYQYHPAHPGQFYHATADIRTLGLNSGQAKVFLQIDFQDADNIVIGTARSAEITSETNPHRVLHIDDLLCPLNTQYLRFAIFVEPLGPVTTGNEFTVGIDRVLLRTNHLRNPDAEFQNNAGWVFSGPDWSVSDAAGDASSGSFGFATTARGGHPAETGTRTCSQVATAQAGQAYTVSADIFAGGSSAGGTEVSAIYASGDGVAKNEVRSDDDVITSDRPGIGGFSGGPEFNGFFFFELPDLSGGGSPTISGVTFSGVLHINTAAKAPGGFNCDVYGFGRDFLSLDADDYHDPGTPPPGTLVQDDYLTPTSPTNASHVIDSAELSALVTSLYNPDGTPASTYLVLRMQPDWSSVPTLTAGSRYRVNSHKPNLDVPSLRIQLSGGGAGGRASEGCLQVEFLDQDRVPLTQTRGPAVSAAQPFTPQVLSGLPAPAGTSFVRVAARVDVISNPVTDEPWRFDNFRLTADVLPDLDRDGLPDADESPNGADIDRPDSDGDTIPDGWEVANGLSPSEPSDATANDDSDMFSNLEEYIAGTKPQDGSSFFFASGSPNGADDFLLRWNAVSGRVYAIQHSPDLITPFVPVRNGIEYPQDSYSHPMNSGSTGFFRVRVRLK